jgi:phage terminase large subunit-like protein
MRNPWKALCLQWKRDYKILRFSVTLYEKLRDGMCDTDFTEDEKDFYTWAKDMEYELDNISDTEQAYRDYIEKGKNVLAYSMLQTPQSLRADLVIFEDVISHNYKTSPQIKQKTDRNFEAVIPILEKNAKVIYIGTRFHPDDLPAQIKENNIITQNWDLIDESAEDEHGKSAYPNIISNVELERLKNTLSRSFYSSQYLNKPISRDEALFKMETYSYYDNMPIRNRFKSIIAGVDLAFSTSKGADSRAIVIVGVDEDGNAYLVDAYDSIEKVEDFYYRIKRLCEKWHIDRVFVEVNGAFKLVYDKFVKKTIDDESNIAFAEVLNRQNKEMRIEVTLIPLLKTGRLRLPKKELYADNPSLKKLIEVEMSFFNPSSRTNKDDLLDALEIACSKLSLYNC